MYGKIHTFKNHGKRGIQYGYMDGFLEYYSLFEINKNIVLDRTFR
jgi:hypothetical protein